MFSNNFMAGMKLIYSKPGLKIIPYTNGEVGAMDIRAAAHDDDNELTTHGWG